MTMKYILGGDSITVVHNSMPYTINRQAPTFKMVLEAIKSNDPVKLEAAVNIRKTVEAQLSALSDEVEVSNGQVIYKPTGRVLTGVVSSRVFEMISLGLDVKPMMNFIARLMKNPSKRAVDELFGFMEACELPVTPDGYFLAYKRVRSDYKDVHSGTMDNSVGKTLEMPRNEVDEDANRTCSYGLHFCSWDYLKHFSGQRVMVLKIDPADVVAIPTDYNNSKGRTCRYTVVDELPVSVVNGLPTEPIPSGYCDDYEPEIEAPVVEVKPSNITGAKIDEDDVRSIRYRFDKGWTVEKLMEVYKLSRRQVKRIVNRESWKHVV